MNTTRFISAALLTLTVLITGCGGDAKKLQAENDALRAENAELKARADADAQAASTRDAELKRLQTVATEAVRLRGEITQLRSGSKDADSLRAENARLKTEFQALRGASPTAANTPATPAAAPGHFPRESWTYAGYQSPESALISAIYSMQQGNPKQYFDSLTPEEQVRMSKLWGNKSPEEIAAKHVNDTSKITGMRILKSQETAPGQMVMSVYIEGVDRAEKVSMKRVGEEWKFGGYIREPAKP
jgi:hypothetical protein